MPNIDPPPFTQHFSIYAGYDGSMFGLDCQVITDSGRCLWFELFDGTVPFTKVWASAFDHYAEEHN